jgi:transcriptional regulator with XRE-family HTH domain
MSDIASCLSKNLRRLREKNDLTQAELAQTAGISLIFLQGIETRKKWLSPTTAKALARALKVSETELFFSHPGQTRKIKRPRNPKLGHIPDDILHALSTTCSVAQWRWEAIRWIIQGFERDT